jgi:Ca-activated chloride channel family protein
MDNPVQFRFLPENDWLLKGQERKTFWLYFELKGGKPAESVNRIPLNISLVLDRSGSMSGDKIEYAKKAVGFVVDNLNPRDFLSIVQYDHAVEVVSPSQQVVHKSLLQDKIKTISARGTTNLSGGTLKGYDEVRSTRKDGYVNRVLLLSDGLANQGITEPETLQQLVQKKFREEGTGLSTFGVGADYDEVLMTNLSEYGGGNYYFIDSPERIPDIFARELKGLLAVVAQNAQLELSFPSDYLEVDKIFGYPFEAEKGKASVHFNDVFAEETKAVLVRFRFNRAADRDLAIQCRFEYDDVHETMGKITADHELTLRLTDDKNLHRDGKNKEVQENIALFLANEKFEDAIREADNRNFDQAQVIIIEIKKYLKEQMAETGDSQMLTAQFHKLEEYENKVKQMGEMSSEDLFMTQKATRMSSYSMRKKKSDLT